MNIIQSQSNILQSSVIANSASFFFNCLLLFFEIGNLLWSDGVNLANDVPIDILFTWRLSHWTFVHPFMVKINYFHEITKRNISRSWVWMIMKLQGINECYRCFILTCSNYLVKFGGVEEDWDCRVFNIFLLIKLFGIVNNLHFQIIVLSHNCMFTWRMKSYLRWKEFICRSPIRCYSLLRGEIVFILFWLF